MEYLFLALLWIGWCVIHSGMISIRTTEALRSRLGTRYRFYRLFFNVVAVATIIPIVLYARSLDGHVLFRWTGIWIAVPAVLLTISALLFLAGARHYDMLQLLGIRQIATGATHNVLTEGGQLDTTGLLSLTRHPWYFAGILFLWGSYLSLDMATLITNVILTTYLIVGTILEEQKLVAQFGHAYREYQNQVPMLLPMPWKKRTTEVEDRGQ